MYVKSKSFKSNRRLLRKVRIRKRLSGSNEKPRLAVYKSTLHTYVQAISDQNGKVLASASTLDKEVKEVLAGLKSDAQNRPQSTKSVLAARAVGIVVAKRVKEKNVENVVFDRAGFVYQGRVKAVADGAREGGLKF